ncbi:MAG: 50S ribosomal protein L11 [Flavobacteriales bacterium Tduv]
MAKKIIKKLRIEKIKGGAANPSPPIGPILGGAGVNIMDFCKQFNTRTQYKQGQVCPVVITVYEDKSFDFIVRNPPVSIQLFETAKLKKGSKEPNRTKVAKVSWDQIKTIAENKMSDFNCFSIESAMSMVAGTARSMGIEVYGESPVHS